MHLQLIILDGKNVQENIGRVVIRHRELDELDGSFKAIERIAEEFVGLLGEEHPVARLIGDHHHARSLPDRIRILLSNDLYPAVTVA